MTTRIVDVIYVRVLVLRDTKLFSVPFPFKRHIVYGNSIDKFYEPWNKNTWKFYPRISTFILLHW